MLGVATLIIVMSVMNGYESALLGKVLSIQGHLHLTQQENGNSSGDLNDLDETILKVRKMSGVSSASRVIEQNAAITMNGVIKPILIKSIDPSDACKQKLFRDSLLRGDLNKIFSNNNDSDGGGSDGVIVGSSLANELKLKIGDGIKVVLPSFHSSIMGYIPIIKAFKVMGVFDLGVYEYNAAVLFTSFDVINDLPIDSKNSYIEVSAGNISDIARLKNDIYRELSGGHVTDWRQNNQVLSDALNIERNVMFIILSLIIMIAAFNIVSSLMILIKEKQKSIAILRTIGASKRSIVMIFIMYGGFIGVAGTMLGAMLGVAFSLYIESIKTVLERLLGMELFNPVVYFLTTLPSEVSVSQVATIVILSLCVTLLATIYPALKISSMSASTILRHE